MKDNRGEIIYVGKAANLRARVISYFRDRRDVKTRLLVGRISTIDHITTGSEYEALLLENTLIKKWAPRYNISLKDGKSYPVIRVTNEDFPRVFRTRHIVLDGSSYYGPYPDAGMVDRYLKVIDHAFLLRKCPDSALGKGEPCFYARMGRCAGPCVGRITKEEYAKTIEQVKDLLSGKTLPLVKRLNAEMKAASLDRRFERAAELRDAIAAIRAIGEEQKVVDFDADSRDYIAMAQRSNSATFAVLEMRGGRLTGSTLFRSEIHSAEGEAMAQFVLQYYARGRKPPAAIYVMPAFDARLVAAYLREQSASAVELRFPSEGRHLSLLRMALENASEDLASRRRPSDDVAPLEELRSSLGLVRLPRRIEGIDVAHLAGKHTVAALVSFRDGSPDKENYRLFNVKSLEGKINDYEAIREIVARRYTRIVNEKRQSPDLLLVDGGKGQVSAARAILDAIGLAEVELAGLAKRLEDVYLPGRSEPISLAEGSPALKLLQAVRDEAHRFATTRNRRLRRRDLEISLLVKIPGIGEKRGRTLLETFGSLAGIAKAPPDAIAERCSLPGAVARRVVTYLKERPTAAGSGAA